MGNVSIDIRELSGLTPGTANLKDAVVWFYPYRPYGAPQLVTTDKLVVDTVDGVATTFLPETQVGNGVYVEIRRVRLPEASRKFIVAIPGTDCNLFDLPHLDPTTLDPDAPLDPAWLAALEAAVPAAGTTGYVLTKGAGGTNTWSAGGGGGGAVASVNTKTGVVVINPDDLDDSATAHKFVTAAEKTKLGNTSGTNTGDQDLSGLVPKTTTVNTKPLSSNVTLTQDDVGDGTTAKQYSATEKTKLSGIATGATANSTDATLLARANHTGTESADVLTDGTTNKAFLATERTKLAGIASGATANSADATLLARANHTGTQTASTISDFSTAADARVVAGITGKADTASPTFTGDPKAPTPASSDNDTSIATTAYVNTVADIKIRAKTSIIFKPEMYSGVGDGVADDTTAVNAATAAALAASAFAAGGGTVVFEGVYKCLGQLVFPNNGASSYPKQGTVKWRGVAPGYSNPVAGSGTPPAFELRPGTLDLRWSDAGDLKRAKIASLGTGTLDIDDLNIYDGGTSSNPFFKPTNTRFIIRPGVSFMGNPSKFRGTCNQDAIVLGGNTLPGSGDSSLDEDGPFQGYGSIIYGAQFHRIRSAVKWGTYANGVTVRDLNIWASCGSDTDSIGAYQMTPGNGLAVGNLISGGIIELAGYKYAAVVDNAQGNTFDAINGYDPDPARTAAVIYFASVNGQNNMVRAGYASTATHPYMLEAVPNVNTIIDGGPTGTSRFLSAPTMLRGLITQTLFNLGAGFAEVTLGGGSNPPGIYVINAGTPSFSAPSGSICVVKSAQLGLTLWVKQWGTGSGSGWAPVGVATITRQLLVKTGNYTLHTDPDDVVAFNGTSLTATLPSAAAVDGARQFTIKNLNSSALTLATTSSQTIDGAAPGTLAQWAKVTVISDGSNWLTV